jgi:hypothetical protein
MRQRITHYLEAVPPYRDLRRAEPGVSDFEDIDCMRSQVGLDAADGLD